MTDSPLSDRIKYGKSAWATLTGEANRPVRTVRDRLGRLSEETLINGIWTAPKG